MSAAGRFCEVAAVGVGYGWRLWGGRWVVFYAALLCGVAAFQTYGQALLHTIVQTVAQKARFARRKKGERTMKIFAIFQKKKIKVCSFAAAIFFTLGLGASLTVTACKKTAPLSHYEITAVYE